MIDKIIKLFIKKHEVKPGDLVTTLNSGPIYEVISCYYSEDLKPVLMVRGGDNKLVSGEANMFKPYGGSVQV